MPGYSKKLNKELSKVMQNVGGRGGRGKSNPNQPAPVAGLKSIPKMTRRKMGGGK